MDFAATFFAAAFLAGAFLAGAAFASGFSTVALLLVGFAAFALAWAFCFAGFLLVAIDSPVRAQRA
jgi:hypothetical protein